MDPYAPNRYAAEAMYREALNELGYLHRGLLVYTFLGRGARGVIRVPRGGLANRLSVLAALIGAAITQYDSGLDDSPALRCIVAFQK